MIHTIQAWRGLAALLVVLFHTTGMVSARYGIEPLSGAFRCGFSGVHLFFVLSGFIILSAHMDDIGVPRRIFHYLGRRIIRIYPIYLIIFMVWGGWRIFTGGMSPAEFFLNALVFSSHNKQVIAVSWTLLYEIIFYALFCSLILSRKLGALIVAAWMISVIFNNGHSGHHALHPFNLLFGFGIFAALGFFRLRYTADRLRNTLAMTSLALGLVAFVGTAHIYSSLNLGSTAWPDHPLTIWGFGLASVFLSLSAAGGQIEAFFARFGAANLLGNASYSIYLVHLQFERIAMDLTRPLDWIWQEARVQAISNVLLFLIAGFAVALGIVIHLLVEKPVLSFLRSWLSRLESAPIFRRSS